VIYGWQYLPQGTVATAVSVGVTSIGLDKEAYVLQRVKELKQLL
jgi:hypothetical protein